jgi:hypothetical protein
MRHPSQKSFKGEQMAEVKIDFEWSRAYSSRGGACYEVRDGKIWQVGDRKQEYRPFELGKIYLEFERLDGSSEACIAFAEKYGLLTEKAILSTPPSEDLSFWRSQIKRMLINVRTLPRLVRITPTRLQDGTVELRGTYSKVGSVDVLLLPGEGANAPPVMALEPSNLLQAMNLGMAHFVSGGGRLIPCQNCGILFQAGRSGGKRTISRFHNDDCRQAFHNAKRGKSK